MANPITALAAVRRRLAKLKPQHPYFDVAPLFMPIFEAMVEGRPFSWLPSERELSPEAEQALERTLRDLDNIAKRMETQEPGCTAAFQAEVERKRGANLRAIEREQAALGMAT